MMTEFFLAFCLITSSPVDPNIESVDEYFYLAPYCKILSLHLEILDHRETKYIFTENRDFAYELNLIRDRYHKLHDAPPISDVYKFPSYDACADFIAFNRGYVACMYAKMKIAPPYMQQEYMDAISEAQELYEIWDLISDISKTTIYLSYKRELLKALKNRIGEDAYYGGYLPPYVPLWRFKEIG